MKTIVVLVGVLLLASPLLAQEEETLLKGTIESGGFGGPVVKIGSLNGESGVLVGGRGGWIINHTFILGGGGYGLVNNVRARVLGPRGERYLAFGYGGLELEYVPEWNKLIHVSFMTLVGGGGVGWRDTQAEAVPREEESDAFFILEPAANVTLNVTPYFRISAGVSYRYVTGVNSAASSNSELSGPSGVLTFRFGTF
ncbi:MAG: hypothetical protein FJ217_06165 [Ignavibacteria bacterium]|nr:hypothetical protein [Ignavibacteria bacterium]